jgi:hypothetical protein
MKYTEKTFTVTSPNTKQYRDNWEATFGSKEPEPAPTETPAEPAEPSKQP